MFHFYNVKIKSYPSGMQKMTIASCPIFRDKGDSGDDLESADLSKTDRKTEGRKEKGKKAGESTRDDSAKRSRDRAYDIAMINDWDYFITWTYSPEKIDRYDDKAIARQLRDYLHNMVKRHSFCYLVIPEYHKDKGQGKAIHVHGLCSGDIKLEDSGKKTKNGETIYNMPQWKMGYSTVMKLYGEPEAYCRYIMKYITKENKMIFGNYYWAGGGIRREPDIHLTDTDYKSLDAKEYYIEQAHCGFKYLNVNSDGEVF